MTILIIEDEPRAAEKLIRTLKRISDDFVIEKVIESVIEGVNYLKRNSVDVILSDIHLSDGLSFEIFETLGIDIPVIFTTAHDNYAIKAFKANSVDYLLKPIKKLELETALDKYKRLKQNSISETISYKSLMQVMQPNDRFKKRFLVETASGELTSVFTEDIAYFFADGKYTFLMTIHGKKYFCKTNISNLNAQVNPESFFQLNRKYITHIGSIKQILKYSKSRLKVMLLPPTEDEVIVSNERAQHFKAWLDGNS